jgi:dTDP-4-amino-4,6-dideoxygalactose transaminase
MNSLEKQFVPLADLSRWDLEEKLEISKAINRVIDSGLFFNGDETNGLRLELIEKFGFDNMMFVGNGTDALVIALLALGIKEGDKVATVGNAGGYGTTAILQVGAIPVLVDVDQDTAQMSTEHLKSCLESNEVVLVIVTHLYGLLADIVELANTAKNFGALLIEDCAQSIGASRDGVFAGTVGDASTFSFYPTKNLACLGDGGAIAFRSTSAAIQASRIAQYGWEGRYNIIVENGRNSRIDELQAAVLRVRLKTLETKNEARNQIVKRFSLALNSSRRFIFKDDKSYIGHLAVMVTDTRDADIQSLSNENIGFAIHYPILDCDQIAWSRYFKRTDIPNSRYLSKRIISVPCSPNLAENEIERMCNLFASLQ